MLDNTTPRRRRRVVKQSNPRPVAKKPGRHYKQGTYQLRHPDKYVGDVTKVRFMSSWELEFHKFLDNNMNIIEWSSEELKIPYLKPTTGRVHIYLPDYWVKYLDSSGQIIEEIIEVKPEKETRAPRGVGKNKKTQLYEQLTWAVNEAKWKAAALYCKKRGIKFRVITEKHLFK